MQRDPLLEFGSEGHQAGRIRFFAGFSFPCLSTTVLAALVEGVIQGDGAGFGAVNKAGFICEGKPWSGFRVLVFLVELRVGSQVTYCIGGSPVLL